MVLAFRSLHPLRIISTRIPSSIRFAEPIKRYRSALVDYCSSTPARDTARALNPHAASFCPPQKKICRGVFCEQTLPFVIGSIRKAFLPPSTPTGLTIPGPQTLTPNQQCPDVDSFPTINSTQPTHHLSTSAGRTTAQTPASGHLLTPTSPAASGPSSSVPTVYATRASSLPGRRISGYVLQGKRLAMKRCFPWRFVEMARVF